MRLRTKTGEAGYNMLELVATIAVVGVLAAVAAPKFVSTNKAARASTVISATETLKSVNRMVYVAAATEKIIAEPGNAACVSGITAAPATGPYVNMGGGTASNIYVCTAYGFARDAAALEQLIDLGEMVVNGESFEHSQATDSSKCRVTYVPAIDPNTPPVYTVDTSDCS